MNQPDLSQDSTSSASNGPFVVGPNSGSGFVDRRSSGNNLDQNSERRQFGSSHSGLSEDGKELALAIDRYKVTHHRRYLTCDEMISVLRELGYRKGS